MRGLAAYRDATRLAHVLYRLENISHDEEEVILRRERRELMARLRRAGRDFGSPTPGVGGST